jgi:hypothetical protein
MTIICQKPCLRLSARGSASICMRGPKIISSFLSGRSKIVCEIEYASDGDSSQSYIPFCHEPD